MRRFLAAAVLALAALAVGGAGSAHASTVPPMPENPMANGGYSAFSPEPSVIPAANDKFDSSDLLTYYGTAGPTLHFYELNPMEEVGASLWVELANDAVGPTKIAIAAVASLATWVFNPGEFLSQMEGPTNESAHTLSDQLATPILPVVLVLVAIAIAWAARAGKVGRAVTRIVFTLVGLALVGLAVASPASLAGRLSGLLSDTVAGVLVPTPQQVDDEVKSDADAAAYAHAKAAAKAQIGQKMLGPIWKSAEYDPWVMGTFGSATSKTATENAPALFQAQALTWAEAKAVENKPDETKALIAKKGADWQAVAKKVNEADPAAYTYLQGSRTSISTTLVTWTVTMACLPFLTVAVLMVLGGYLGLFLLAALLPVIALWVIVRPEALATVGKFLAAILVNTIVFAAASVIITKVAAALFAGGTNLLFASLVVGTLSFIAWKFLRSFRSLRSPGSAGEGSVTHSVIMQAAVSEAVEQATKRVTQRGGRAHPVDDPPAPLGAPDDTDADTSARPRYATFRRRPEATRWDLDMSAPPSQAEAPDATLPAPQEGGGTDTPAQPVRPAAAHTAPPAHGSAPEVIQHNGSAAQDEREQPQAPRPLPAGARVVYDPRYDEEAEGVVA